MSAALRIALEDMPLRRAMEDAPRVVCVSGRDRPPCGKELMDLLHCLSWGKDCKQKYFALKDCIHGKP